MERILFKSLLSSFFILFFSHSLWGFKLSPMVATFSPDGDGRTTSFFVENTSDKKVAVQIDILYRTQSEKGEEVRTETKDFTVYPPQIILKANQKRTIRVTWLGAKKLSQELAFRLVAEELPIELQKKKKEQRTNINFLLKYVASIYVTPDGAKSKVEVKSAKEEIVKGKKHLALVLENTGNAHKVLNDIRLKIKSGEAKVDVDAKSLEAFAAENILAKSKKKFLLPWPKTLSGEKLEVDLSFADSLGKKQK